MPQPQQQPQKEPTCADAVVQRLSDAGLQVCFANPGTTEMFLVAALEAHKGSMRSILCLHESVCTGAADGYARIAATPAMALLHLGPGLGNGLCNLHNAHRARSPVLVLVGEHATWHKAADPVLAQDIQALAATVSGHVLSIQSPETVADTVERALVTLATPVAPASSGTGSSSQAAATGVTDPPKTTPAAAQGEGGSSSRTSCPSSRVVTVVLPHDISWAPAAAAGLAPASQPNLHQLSAQQAPLTVAASPAAQRFLSDCAAALVAAPRGKAALVLGGAALLAEGARAAGFLWRMMWLEKAITAV